MKKLYTFYWDDGKREEPLQATSVKHALAILIGRYQTKNPSFDKFIILRAFHDGSLNYDLDEPYQNIRQPNPPKPKPPKPRQLGFKNFLDGSSFRPKDRLH